MMMMMMMTMIMNDDDDSNDDGDDHDDDDYVGGSGDDGKDYIDHGGGGGGERDIYPLIHMQMTTSKKMMMTIRMTIDASARKIRKLVYRSHFKQNARQMFEHEFDQALEKMQHIVLESNITTRGVILWGRCTHANSLPAVIIAAQQD
ncbi:hypothetical protein ElyMa_005491000 [Elysia marginata]|uniref:Uncharacterized protein n=1 Tax=Elysia marginata TaxID=1093978 RepID=A0AAV4ERX0_9GAST|nr:hypothetical protein ElyMa_005491000 [Elysia marginata]